MSSSNNQKHRDSSPCQLTEWTIVLNTTLTPRSATRRWDSPCSSRCRLVWNCRRCSCRSARRRPSSWSGDAPRARAARRAARWSCSGSSSADQLQNGMTVVRRAHPTRTPARAVANKNVGLPLALVWQKILALSDFHPNGWQTTLTVPTSKVVETPHDTWERSGSTKKRLTRREKFNANYFFYTNNATAPVVTSDKRVKSMSGIEALDQSPHAHKPPIKALFPGVTTLALILSPKASSLSTCQKFGSESSCRITFTCSSKINTPQSDNTNPVFSSLRVTKKVLGTSFPHSEWSTPIAGPRWPLNDEGVMQCSCPKSFLAGSKL